MGIEIYLADRNLRPLTDPVAWTDVDAVVRHLEPGRASVTCAATSQVTAALAAAGTTAVIMNDEQSFMAGPVERPHGPYEWGSDGGTAADPGRVTFHSTDYLGLISGRGTLPDPSTTADDQGIDTRYEQTAAAGTILTDLVDLNCGPGAIVGRRIPRLVIGGGAGEGPTITWGTRFQPLGPEMRAIVATTDGALGFRAVFDRPTRLVTFECFATLDRSGTVRFNRGLGNLRSVIFESEIPRVTSAIVAGEGEGTARTIVERINSDAEAGGWRIEKFIDRRDTSDLTELEQTGDEHLADGAATARLATVTVDLPDQRYGVHYGLGDLAEYEPIPGFVLVDRVQAVHLQATPRTGALMTAMVGSQSMSNDPAWLRASRELARRMARLEAV